MTVLVITDIGKSGVIATPACLIVIDRAAVVESVTGRSNVGVDIKAGLVGDYWKVWLVAKDVIPNNVGFQISIDVGRHQVVVCGWIEQEVGRARRSYHLGDLRGLTVDEAVEVVERYLADARTSGLSTVRIIHGKGTGVLRKEIGRYLKGNRLVKSQRLGNWNEGDTGVTIAELK